MRPAPAQGGAATDGNRYACDGNCAACRIFGCFLFQQDLSSGEGMQSPGLQEVIRAGNLNNMILSGIH